MPRVNRSSLSSYLFPVFAIVFLYEHNSASVNFIDVIPAIFLALAVIFALLQIVTLASGSSEKSSAIVAIVTMIFFSHGYASDIIYGWEVAGVLIGRNLYLLVLFGTFFLGWCWIILSSKVNVEKINRILLVICGVLLVTTVGNVAYGNLIRSGGTIVRNQTMNGTDRSLVGVTPDIYYIILDGYTSSSNLLEYYHFDNKEFTDYLRQKGFYIAEKSHSNYATTFLSLTSSLNMVYLNDYCERYENDLKVPRQLGQLIEKNEVVNHFKSKGYNIVHFSSGYGATNYSKLATWNVNCGRLNEFNRELIHTTLLRLVEERLVEGDARHRILNAFDRLPEVRKKIAGPRFVFAHIISPHSPYLFDSRGNAVNHTPPGMKGDGLDMWQLKEPYLEQLKFVNKKIEAVITKLLAESETPPIIIVQGDHGSASTGGWQNPSAKLIQERMGILNAVYLPENLRGGLYSSITPVNTFRSILNCLYNSQIPLLEDRNYFSSYDKYYQLRDVTEIVSSK